MEIGEFEVLPVWKRCPLICGVTDRIPDEGSASFIEGKGDGAFRGIYNFPPTAIVDGNYRQILARRRGMSLTRGGDRWYRRHKCATVFIVYVAKPEEAIKMAEAGSGCHYLRMWHHCRGSVGVRVTGASCYHGGGRLTKP